MIQRSATALLGVVMAIGSAGAEDAPAAKTPTWSTAAASEVRFFSWQSTRGYPANGATAGGSGSQLYIPYAVELIGRPRDDLKVEIVARGGWVWARQSTAGLTGEVATSTDTVMAATMTYYGFNGIQPFVSLNANLPTGRSQLFGTAANARMDPDLVELSSFGEGFNIGPTVGINLPFSNSLLMTLSVGYTWRDRYWREQGVTSVPPVIQLPTQIDPGDVFTVTGGLTYKSGAVSASVLGSITKETATTEDGTDLYRAGLRYLVAANLGYAWPDAWGATSLSASMAYNARNDVMFLIGNALTQEPFNSNSRLYRVGIEHLFPFGQVALGPTGSFLFRDHDGYNPTTLQFVPAKERWAAGAQARYAAGDKVTFNARFEHVWVHEDDSPTDAGRKFSVLANAFVPGSAVPVVSSTGWQGALGLTVKF